MISDHFLFSPVFLRKSFCFFSSLSNARERKQRECKKVGILFFPFCPPLQGRCGGSPRDIGERSGARPNSRHPASLSLVLFVPVGQTSTPIYKEATGSTVNTMDKTSAQYQKIFPSQNKEEVWSNL